MHRVYAYFAQQESFEPDFIVELMNFQDNACKI